jgi:hypothetical protein
MSEFEVLIEFKNQLIAFFDELIGQFPEEGDLVVVRLFLSSQIPIQDAMNIFNHKINTNDQELLKMVKDRNEAFFLEHSVFDNLGKEKISHFKRLWRSGRLDDEDKLVIWNWIDAFIYLGDKYTKAVMNR